MRNLRTRLLTSLVLCAAVGALALSGLPGAGAAAALDDGVSANSIKIGYITSKTGVAGSTTGNADKGCQARIGRENAQGGVNKRKLDVTYVDDQSSGANKTAAQDLVQNKHVFMIVNNSAFAFLTYQFLLDNNVPMIGGGYDGTYYGAPGNEDAISALGNVINANGVTYDGLPKLMKKMGATKVAALGYGISPSSTAAAENLQKFAVPEVGLKAVYTNTTVDFGTTDVGPQVLGIKNAGADAVYLPLDAQHQHRHRAGPRPERREDEVDGPGHRVRPTAPRPARLQDLRARSPARLRVGAGRAQDQSHQAVPSRPQEVRRLHRGTRLRPVHRLHHLRHGDRGLAERRQPTHPRRVRPNLRKVGTYDQAGLACQPIDISVATYGKAAPTQCGYYLQIKNGKYVPFPNAKPVTGKLIGASTVTTTTTTSPPAQ